ncbi:ArsR/SmtB family transcription factor [Phosphitispora fastidiosa]|uniref:ArsR/SmtB family transcription factor n=1 Tax=Phosphitispora fastidiosa TaxID=2837202 RepID=UPI001E2B94A6|nr:metalloregulator ArsR/SmtB family transcription factor [Phosphitispora fastidiosa]MBU7006921.1 ArsR family transcriptional regulator [Phosphitispora fastidiosa]
MKKIAEFYKALGDEIRLTILNMLSEQEMCVCEIFDKLDISQPAVSHHLKILRQAGLVKDSKEGKWIYYSLNGSVFQEIFQDEKVETIRCYAEPIRKKLENLPRSQVRTDPAVCEKLTAKNR